MSGGYYSSTDYVRRFAEALKADPSAHRVGCSAWERRTGASLSLDPETLLKLCAEVDELKERLKRYESAPIQQDAVRLQEAGKSRDAPASSSEKDR